MERLRLKIYRYNPAHDSGPSYQDYEIETDGSLSVLQAIRRIYHTVDPTLSFRNSDCRRGVCGICSMMMDGKRALTCMHKAESGVTVAPPPNRRVIKDLVFETD
jgi:succinate dehydrogenase/fumarate reductase iron-sulfur protein